MQDDLVKLLEALNQNPSDNDGWMHTGQILDMLGMEDNRRTREKVLRMMERLVLDGKAEFQQRVKVSLFARTSCPHFRVVKQNSDDRKRK